MHANRDTAEMVNDQYLSIYAGRTVVGVVWFTPSLSICYELYREQAARITEIVPGVGGSTLQ